MSRISSLIVLLLLLAPASGGPARAENPRPAAEAIPVSPALTIEPYRFEARSGEAVKAELGRFTVPENRHKKGGRTLELHFVRFPSTAKSPGPPIVYLAGGPGGSGTATARGSRFVLFQALRAVADVIAFDQRATGMNDPLPPCSQSWNIPWEQAGTRAAHEAAARNAARLCAAEWRQADVDLDAYTTEASADDLEDLRKALGAEKISLWSISYGTHLAMSTTRRHPGSVASVILAGSEGPDHTLKLPSDGQRLLERLQKRIDGDRQAKAAFPSFLDDVAAVLRSLDEKPRPVAVPDGQGGMKTLLLGSFDVRLLAAGMLGAPEWQRYLPAMFRAMAEGVFDPVAPFLGQVRSGELYAMSLAMDAASGVSPERRRRIAEEAKGTLLEDAINFPWGPVREALGVRDLGSAFRAPLQTDVPALFISGTFDGRTPVTNAEDLLPGFRRAHHLVLEGAGHSDPLFLSSGKILEIMTAFLEGKPLEKEMRIAVPFPAWDGLEGEAPPS